MSQWIGAHGFDLGIGLLLLAGGIWGGWRGFTRELISLLGLLAVLLITIWGSTHLSPLLEPLLTLTWLRHAIGALIIFIVASLAYIWLAKRLSQARQDPTQSGTQRLLGALLGLVRWGLIATIGLMLLTRFYPQGLTRLTAKSTLSTPLNQAGHLLLGALPTNLQAGFRTATPRVKPPTQPASRQRAQSPKPRSDSPGITPSDEEALRRIIRERLREDQ